MMAYENEFYTIQNKTGDDSCWKLGLIIGDQWNMRKCVPIGEMFCCDMSTMFNGDHVTQCITDSEGAYNA